MFQPTGQITVNEGDIINSVKHSGMRSGVLICHANTKEELMDKAQEYTNKIVANIKMS